MILFRRFRRGEVIFGLALLGVLVICFVCWPALSSVNPYQSQVSNRLRSPSFIHPFGTDDFGRDVLVRVMYAGRLSLALGFMVAAFACLAGTALGLVAAGFFAGSMDLSPGSWTP
jgi:peptide/nickel transport system permease protein